MSFVHRPGEAEETIAAIATPPGEGGVAIIRISGKQALEIGDRVFNASVPQLSSHQVHYGLVKNSSGEPIDRVLLLPMHQPRSYTGEDTVEIHCHGGSLITQKCLQCVIDAGARLARPGEFTLRAFLNGKMDLSQAEAVQELISARNDLAVNAAETQLEGKLSKKIREKQQALTQIAAILEAWVDFPEEGLEFASMEETVASLSSINRELQALSATFHDGKLVHDGLSVCLLGRPNVGKSSLMNCLLERDRAIVTAIAGTTRDTLEDELRLNGLNLRVIDTAGIRESAEEVEQEGIRRSWKAVEEADLILCLLDLTSGLTEEDHKLLKQLKGKRAIVLWNKSDLFEGPPPSIDWPYIARISAKESQGIDRLKSMIDEVIWDQGPPVKGEIILTRLRHKEAIDRAITACQRLIEGLKTGVSPEFLTLDMRTCLVELGQIIGTDITEDVLSAIFSTFCVGK